MKDLLPFLGLNINGDLGHLTIYTRKNGRLVAFDRAPPLVPASPRQNDRRNLFAQAMKNWTAESPETKLLYRRVCDVLALCMLGHNLYIALSFNPDVSLLQTLRRQSCIYIPRPTVLQ